MSGGSLLILHELDPMIRDPDVKSAITAMNFPAYVGLSLAIIGVITLAARSHVSDISSDPYIPQSDSKLYQ